MDSLIFDLSVFPTVVLLSDNKVVDLSKNEQTQNSDTFLLMVDNLLKNNKKQINDIKRIFINVGPGSFTGLRVAISISKGLGFAGDIEFCTYTTFDYVDGANSNVLVSGFSNFVYLKTHDGTMSCENCSNLDKTNEYITFEEELYSKLKSKINIKLVEKVGFDQVTLKAKMGVSISTLEPLYLRKSQAEIQREERINKK